LIKLVCLVSRQWSLNILKKLEINQNLSIQGVFFDESSILKKSKLFKLKSKNINPYNLILYENNIKDLKPDIILAYGWSYFIPNQIREICKVLVLHPSNLPKYRGGSPIQNQILDGINTTDVCIFIANKKIDSGPIIYREKLSLKGYLNEIFKRITTIGVRGTLKIIDDLKKGQLIKSYQNEKLATYKKRRKPSMSEIVLNDFVKFDAEYIYNKVRSLQKPYPRVFIKCKNNTKIYLDKVSLD